ncbi:MAG: Crp/Fnr family transcriptional regulator [Prevotella sp.]|nr:Crp/Fnr family transcriptional regulator [Prevotella sp.]
MKGTDTTNWTKINYEEIAQTMTPLWEALTDEERGVMAEALQVFTYQRNDIIFKTGDEPRFMFYLLDGRVTLYREGIGGRSQIVRLVEPGGIFGCQASFNDEPQLATAVAGEDLHVAALPLKLLFHLIWENGAFAMCFIKELSNLLGTSLKRTISMTQKHIRGRLAEVLLAIHRKYGVEPDGQTLSIYLSRDDLAQMSNMTTSNAIRTLSAFAQEGLVAIEGRRIRLLAPDRLRQISDMG